jgi:hypothetical protein
LRVRIGKGEKEKRGREEKGRRGSDPPHDLLCAFSPTLLFCMF